MKKNLLVAILIFVLMGTLACNMTAQTPAAPTPTAQHSAQVEIAKPVATETAVPGGRQIWYADVTIDELGLNARLISGLVAQSITHETATWNYRVEINGAKICEGSFNTGEINCTWSGKAESVKVFCNEVEVMTITTDLIGSHHWEVQVP